MSDLGANSLWTCGVEGNAANRVSEINGRPTVGNHDTMRWATQSWSYLNHGAYSGVPVPDLSQNQAWPRPNHFSIQRHGCQRARAEDKSWRKD